MEQTFTTLVDLFDNLIEDAKREMPAYVNFNSDEVRVSAPSFIIDYFQKALTDKYRTVAAPLPPWQDFKYRGLPFSPCYEMEISVWHKDYPIYKEPWMLKKVSLHAPFVTHEERYSKYTILLRPLIEHIIGAQHHELN